nr:hypothetical protein KKPOJJPN_00008 [Methanosarcinales archaeon ANME-2c ERB4]
MFAVFALCQKPSGTITFSTILETGVDPVFVMLKVYVAFSQMLTLSGAVTAMLRSREARVSAAKTENSRTAVNRAKNPFLDDTLLLHFCEKIRINAMKAPPKPTIAIFLE